MSSECAVTPPAKEPRGLLQNRRVRKAKASPLTEPKPEAKNAKPAAKKAQPEKKKKKPEETKWLTAPRRRVNGKQASDNATETAPRTPVVGTSMFMSICMFMFMSMSITMSYIYV